MTAPSQLRVGHVANQPCEEPKEPNGRDPRAVRAQRAITPRTYWALGFRPSGRALADADLTGMLAGIDEPDARSRRPPESLCGLLKMWEHLRRHGIGVARCTVERRMRANGWDIPQVEPPEPTRLGEVVWLEAFPDALLEGATGVPPGPEARYEQTEAISLAFVTALQVLPARQLAVLILRDVLGFRANEVADMLDSTAESVNSALKRARASLQRRQPPTGEREPAPASGSPSEDALVAKFVRAYESGDVDALVALFTDDIFLSMPPIPLEYQGRDVVARLCASIFS